MSASVYSFLSEATPLRSRLGRFFRARKSHTVARTPPPPQHFRLGAACLIAYATAPGRRRQAAKRFAQEPVQNPPLRSSTISQTCFRPPVLKDPASHDSLSAHTISDLEGEDAVSEALSAPETSERGDRRYINPDIWSDYRILGEAVVGAPEPRPQPEGIEFRKARQLPWSSRLVTLDRLPLYGHWGVVVGGIRPYVAAAVP
ncbi:hypothetical protein MRX96_015573 [Rhipicephalus microplus]